MTTNNKICRLCMKTKDDLEQNPDDVNYQIQSDLQLKIENLVGVKIDNNDGLLPQKVCLKCTETINTFGEFAEKCQKSDVILRKIFKKEERFRHSSNIYTFRCPTKIAVKSENNNILKIVKRDTSNIVLKVDSYMKSMADGKLRKMKNKKPKKQEMNPKIKCNVRSYNKRRTRCKVCRHLILQQRMMSHLLAHTDAYKCNLCGARHSSKNLLNRHKKIKHRKQTIFGCYVCGLETPSLLDLNRHLSRHKSKLRKKRRKNKRLCEICEKQNLGNKFPVINVISTENTCDVCQKTFSHQSSLNRHKKSHNITIKCGSCTKMFPSYLEFEGHQCDTLK
ncbi:unnamed protein product [Brassicogethes aeneus]|uniref:Uncharacterized protein n=1 Tax=Brassicogethes aeneus TaxID=1431903 RepID=A0A9P0FES7_BRAAE|nr:unnamed protein product [Brassicogethes aeneus]